MISTRSLARPTVAAATLATLATFALAGCSEPTTDTNERPASSTTTASSPASEPATEPGSTETTTSAAPEPSEATTSAAPEPTETTPAEPAGAGRPSGRLLSAAEVPGFNEDFTWKQGATRTSEPRALFGTCQRFAISSIGATSVAVRHFSPTRPGQPNPPDLAGELVAEFPDTATAQRAFAVLKSWRKQCGDRVPPRGKVGALQDVPVDGGTGGWYLLTYPSRTSRDDAFFDAQGMTVVGTRIAMVKLRLLGQDYNYEPGQEPMVAALQHAAAKLT
ncbi:MAG: hypothetical protein ABIQ59_02830 [Nocardioidaceae bacterium]